MEHKGYAPCRFIKDYRTSPETRIRILSEGAVTEVQYLKEFISRFKLSADRTSIHPPTHSDPLGIVKTAAAELSFADFKRALSVRKRAHRSVAHTEVWCLFDRDQHEHYDKALDFGLQHERHSHHSLAPVL